MQESNVQSMFRRFDPMSASAESHYDTVVRRINRVRARRRNVDVELAELERQFVEGDLMVQTGPCRGEPLSKRGRRARLARLLDLGIESRRLASEERFSVEALDRMNEALDRWAKDTYGS